MMSDILCFFLKQPAVNGDGVEAYMSIVLPTNEDVIPADCVLICEHSAAFVCG